MSALLETFNGVKTKLVPGSFAPGSSGRSKPEDAAASTLITDRLPEANLVPAASLVSYERWLWKRRVIFAAVALLAVVVALWTVQTAAIGWAQHQLDAAQERTMQLEGEKARLAPVMQLNSQIEMQRTALDQANASNTDASRLLSQLRGSLGPATLLQYTMTLPADPATMAQSAAATGIGSASPCGDNPDPFTSQQTIGCIKFSARASSRGAISGILDRLAATPGFTSATVTSTDNAAQGSGVEFSGSVAITPMALTRSQSSGG